MPRRVSTIYDLAELAGVSASTVSAVLSGKAKARRIAEPTVAVVQRLAETHKFTLNRQASGLRRSRSGLIGMIIPMHDNRFFSEMSRAFERLARERHWYPIVVSTLRDPTLELETVTTLLSYRIEQLIVTGATDPDSVGRACRAHGVAHVNVDLPGTTATSVVSDNYWGAQQLTRALIERSTPLKQGATRYSASAVLIPALRGGDAASPRRARARRPARRSSRARRPRRRGPRARR